MRDGDSLRVSFLRGLLGVLSGLKEWPRPGCLSLTRETPGRGGGKGVDGKRLSLTPPELRLPKPRARPETPPGMGGGGRQNRLGAPGGGAYYRR